MELLRYIHLNGTRAGKFESPRWDKGCSHAAYLGLGAGPSWLTTTFGLAHFGKDEPSARTQFSLFVNQGLPDHLRDVMEGGKWPAIWGSETFIKDIRMRFKLGQPMDLEKPQEKGLLSLDVVDPIRVIHYVAHCYQISIDKLRKPFSKKYAVARSKAMVLLRRKCLLGYIRIGEHMGGVQDSAVERSIKKWRMET